MWWTSVDARLARTNREHWTLAAPETQETSGEHDMTAVRDLTELLATLAPQLDDVTLVYALVPSDSSLRQQLADSAIARVEEHEGTTLVLPIDVAVDNGLRYEFPCRRLTLQVRSDLEAVGLTAAFAAALAAEGMPANVLAGFHHDHILVSVDHAEAARDVLVDLTRPPTVRMAGRADEAFLWQMVRHTGAATPAEDPRSDPVMSGFVEEWGRDDDVGVIAVGASGRQVGAAWCRPLGDDNEHTLAIAVVPSLRGRGVGRMLIATLLPALGEAGVERLGLSVRDTNPATRLFRDLGFDTVGATAHRAGAPSLVMRLELNHA